VLSGPLSEAWSRHLHGWIMQATTCILFLCRRTQIGSRWEHRRTDGSGIADVVGQVVESVPPQRLVITFTGPDDEPADGPSRVAFDIEPYRDIVKLTVTHQNIDNQDYYDSAAIGWASVFANLKSLLETGNVLPQAPWEMHAELRAASMARNDPSHH